MEKSCDSDMVMGSKEKVKLYRKEYYLTHKERIKEQNRATIKRNPQAARERYKRFTKTIKGRYAIYKGGAKARGLIFDVTFADFEMLISSDCYYCGESGYGIDRLDSGKGYIKGNIVPCCTMCNIMKQSYTEEEFVSQCIKISATNTWKRVAIATWV